METQKELEVLFKEYSLTLNHNEWDEWYVTDGQAWDSMFRDFLEWLRLK